MGNQQAKEEGADESIHMEFEEPVNNGDVNAVSSDGERQAQIYQSLAQMEAELMNLEDMFRDCQQKNPNNMERACGNIYLSLAITAGMLLAPDVADSLRACVENNRTNPDVCAPKFQALSSALAPALPTYYEKMGNQAQEIQKNTAFVDSSQKVLDCMQSGPNKSCGLLTFRVYSHRYPTLKRSFSDVERCVRQTPLNSKREEDIEMGDLLNECPDVSTNFLAGLSTQELNTMRDRGVQVDWYLNKFDLFQKPH
eukprot:TRINITY_DN11570_c0_g1_i1.p1 TRINITY_DN11570_c0_g1~~TRINITY_DN11570_c0_g1_i1.p1  ORF type:complete len:254 (+),score=36.66 TRINITY_DN11570_c0_g1_i1:15-776(+)